MTKLKSWWREFRRPKCLYCGSTIEKGQMVCERQDCLEKHDTMRMGI